MKTTLPTLLARFCTLVMMGMVVLLATVGYSHALPCLLPKRIAAQPHTPAARPTMIMTATNAEMLAANALLQD